MDRLRGRSKGSPSAKRAGEALPHRIAARDQCLKAVQVELAHAAKQLTEMSKAVRDLSTSGYDLGSSLNGLNEHLDLSFPEWHHLSKALPAAAEFERVLGEKLSSDALVGGLRNVAADWGSLATRQESKATQLKREYNDAQKAYKLCQDTIGGMKGGSPGTSRPRKNSLVRSQEASVRGKKEESNLLRSDMMKAEEDAATGLTELGYVCSYSVLSNLISHFEALEDVLSNMGARLHMQTLPELRHAAEAVREEIAEFQEGQLSPTQDLSKRVFGEHLEVICLREQHLSGVPLFVRNAIGFLCRPATLQNTGLFRISPDHGDIERLKRALNKGQEFSAERMQISDPHAPAALLKTFLRDLGEPLLTFKLYNYFSQIPEDDKFQESIVAGIKQLPPANQRLLQHVMWILHKTQKERDANQMTSTALATIFAPTILYSEDVRNQEIQGTGAVAVMPDIEKLKRGQRVVERMIESYESLFSDESNPNITDLDALYAEDRSKVAELSAPKIEKALRPHDVLLARTNSNPSLKRTYFRSLPMEAGMSSDSSATQPIAISPLMTGRARSSTLDALSHPAISSSAPVQPELASPSSDLSKKGKQSGFARRFGSMRVRGKKSRANLKKDESDDQPLSSSGVGVPTSVQLPDSVRRRLMPLDAAGNLTDNPSAGNSNFAEMVAAAKRTDASLDANADAARNNSVSGAESTQAAAESPQDKAVSTRAGAESKQDGAESKLDGAESNQIGAESKQDGAELELDASNNILSNDGDTNDAPASETAENAGPSSSRKSNDRRSSQQYVLQLTQQILGTEHDESTTVHKTLQQENDEKLESAQIANDETIPRQEIAEQDHTKRDQSGEGHSVDAGGKQGSANSKDLRTVEPPLPSGEKPPPPAPHGRVKALPERPARSSGKKGKKIKRLPPGDKPPPPPLSSVDCAEGIAAPTASAETKLARRASRHEVTSVLGALADFDDL